MMITITCPNCQTEGKMSVAQSTYDGPYRCWKCHELARIAINDNRLESCRPMTEQELEESAEEDAAQKELDALKNKFRKN